MSPVISVIVPIYNAEKYLHRCIDSILAQSYTVFELLLIDDGSTDNSGAICDKYAAQDGRVRVFHKENGGVSSARNLGLDNARGEYVTFCDSDDYVADNWLSVYNDAIENGYDLAIQGICEIAKDVVVSKKLIVNCGHKKEEIQHLVLELFEKNSFCYTVVKLFRLNIINTFSIRFDKCSTLGEDAQFIAKFLEYTESFICVDNVGYYYYLPAESKTYKGDLGYSVFYILKSLDIVFDKNIPHKLLCRHYDMFKNYMLKSIINRRTLEDEYFELYARMVNIDGVCRGINNYVISKLITHSKSGYIAPLILRIIHKLLKRKNSLFVK